MLIYVQLVTLIYTIGGLFMFFKKKQPTEKPLAKRTKALPFAKKVQFCFVKQGELKSMLEADIKSVLSLAPVNYYAEKNRYLLCVLYRDENYTEIILNFEGYENDRKTFSTDYYEINKELYAAVLMKFGQKVSFPEASE